MATTAGRVPEVWPSDKRTQFLEMDKGSLRVDLATHIRDICEHHNLLCLDAGTLPKHRREPYGKSRQLEAKEEALPAPRVAGARAKPTSGKARAVAALVAKLSVGAFVEQKSATARRLSTPMATRRQGGFHHPMPTPIQLGTVRKASKKERRKFESKHPPEFQRSSLGIERAQRCRTVAYSIQPVCWCRLS